MGLSNQKHKHHYRSDVNRIPIKRGGNGSEGGPSRIGQDGRPSNPMGVYRQSPALVMMDRPGILVMTIKNKERAAEKDVIELLERVADELYPETSSSSSLQGKSHQATSNDTEISIEEELQQELAEMQGSKGKSKRFRLCQHDTQCQIYIGVLAPLDPRALVYRIFEEVERTGVSPLKFVSRLIPLTCTGAATMHQLSTLSARILPEGMSDPGTIDPLLARGQVVQAVKEDQDDAELKVDADHDAEKMSEKPQEEADDEEAALNAPAPTPSTANTTSPPVELPPSKAKTFAVVFASRNSNRLSRMDAIRAVADQVLEMRRGHTVDLKSAEKTVVIEVQKNMLGLSVVDHYDRYKKFNPGQFAESLAKARLEVENAGKVAIGQDEQGGSSAIHADDAKSTSVGTAMALESAGEAILSKHKFQDDSDERVVKELRVTRSED